MEVHITMQVNIGIIGDYDGRPSHLATQEALKHCANQLGFEAEYTWLPTLELEDSCQALQKYDGLWCAPGSPYKSMNGAINAIQFAREEDYPFIGTCGGFQHAAIEYGRNVLGIQELKDKAFNLYETNEYITALSCSLIGQSKELKVEKTSILSDIYENAEITEKYNCSMELNKAFQYQLDRNGFRVIGVDNEDEARIITIPGKRFYLATLFQPQLSSSPERPHPMILAYLRVVKEFKS
jgi:CTP synthase (UTP-ammonia lyase)